MGKDDIIHAAMDDDSRAARQKKLIANRALFERLRANRDHLIGEEVTNVSEVSLAKYRISLKPEVNKVLDELQSRAQKRSVGLFERLLTAIVNDVMPGDDTSVKLLLKVERGRPSLDIFVENKGNLEDVMDGRGGSITNIISTGLRFIVLSRMKGRRFIVLDEPDCWLRADKVPAFASVIAQMSKEIGVQCLLISHYDQANFSDKASIVKLEKISGHVVIDADEDEFKGSFGGDDLTGEGHADGLMDGVGIRYIRLVNFMAHEDSLIPLSQNVTALVGDNDIGKSAVVAALRAVSYNGGSDAMIRHGKDKCVVEIGLEEGNVLFWERRKRGSNKTTYRMETEDGIVIHEEDNGKTVPEWVEEYLYMNKVNGIDVHIGHQKTPVFMLGNSVTGTQRASLLSLGKESSYVQEMVGEYGESVRDDGRLIRKGESRLESIRETLKRLSPLSDLELEVDQCEKLPTVLEVRHKESEDLSTLISAIRDSKARHERLDLSIEKLSYLQAPPELLATDEIIRLGVRAKELRQRLTVLESAPSVAPTPPAITDVAELAQIVGRIEYFRARIASGSEILSGILQSSLEIPEIFEVAELRRLERLVSNLDGTGSALNKLKQIEHSIVDVPEINSSSALAELLERFDSAKIKEVQNSESLSKLSVKLRECVSSWESLREKSGGVCPACGGSIKSIDNHNHEEEVDS